MKDTLDTYHRNMILALVLGACSMVAAFSAPAIGLKDAAVLFLGMAGAGVVIALIVHQFMKGSGNLAGGLFLGSNTRDDVAILRGLYQQANGLKLSAHFSEAEKVYRQILVDYPDQLEAHYLLAQMLWMKMERSKEALKMFQDLQNKIRQDGLSFKYQSALQKNIRDIRKEIAAPH